MGQFEAINGSNLGDEFVYCWWMFALTNACLTKLSVVNMTPSALSSCHDFC